MILVDPDSEHLEMALRSGLNGQANQDLQSCLFFSSLPSTSDYLKQHHAQLPSWTLCFTRQQTAGRGQAGRFWLSNQGDLTFSLLFRTREPRFLSRWPLQAAVIIAENLREKGVPCGIKWPNDIMADNQKIGGILVETFCQGTAFTAIIGIGINGISRDGKEPDQPWTALDRYGVVTDEPMPLMSDLLNALIPEFEEPMQDLEKRWLGLDLAWKRQVTFEKDGKTFSGMGEGIDEAGRLKILTSQGILYCHASEVRLKWRR
ncbi:MAG: biotin--[acetyl-CoA-carboxylase] ligase [Gammaproteobacteria bacterium]|nr:MAG: biotin--[acetyl-CoA-carboxylase] ligase [Gammaproteobacteria bacterium]